VIRKSEEQKRREPTKAEKLARREAKKAIETGQPITVVRAGDAEIVSADAFVKPPPKPPFELTGKQRQELLERGRPRITFDRRPSIYSTEDEPCPITVGEIYVVTSQLSFVVTGISETKAEWELHYRIFDERAHNLGKASGYTNSSQGSIATTKKREEQPLGGPQFRDEKEGEALTEEEHAAIVEESREDRIKRLGAHRTLLEGQHRQMEAEGIQADIKWGLRRAIQKLTHRIESEQRALADRATEAA